MLKDIQFSYISQYVTDFAEAFPRIVHTNAGQISTCWADYIDKFVELYTGTLSEKRKMLGVLNSVAYDTVSQNVLTLKIEDIHSLSDIKSFVCPYSENEMKSLLGSAYLEFHNIIWDIEPHISTDVNSISVKSNADKSTPLDKFDTSQSIKIPEALTAEIRADVDSKVISESVSQYRSTRDDISLKFSEFPCFDPQKIWGYGKDAAGRIMPIFTTLPEIPKVQNDISITTDVAKMSTSELINLYPDHLIKVRRDEMYEHIQGFDYDEDVGFIPHITGFTREQVVDNIFKYPQFNFMYRRVNGERVSFMKYIEVDGELIPLSEAINIVEDMQNLPDSNVFYWDYTVRRYLLERDYDTCQHRYPIIGTFGPWMTLFAPPDVYIQRGYTDTEALARKCVINRVLFYQTRNPLLKEMFK